MYTTSIPGVVISREAIDLAFYVGRELERLLAQTAITRVNAAETWEPLSVSGKRVVGSAEIEAAGRTISVDLVALFASARAELHAREEARRVA